MCPALIALRRAEHGDIIIVRAHDAAEIDAIFGGEASDDDESSENLDFASALMFQPWDLLSGKLSSIPRPPILVWTA